MGPTLKEAIKVAREIIQENPDTRNPVIRINGWPACSYFGPDNTSCLAGTAVLRLGGELHEDNENVPVSSIPAVYGWDDEVVEMLQNLQSYADSNTGRAYDENGEDILVPRRWGSIIVSDDGTVTVQE